MFLLEIPEQLKFIIENASPIMIIIGFILLYYNIILGILWIFIILLDVLPVI